MPIRYFAFYVLSAVLGVVPHGILAATNTVTFTGAFSSPDGASINYASINDNGDVIFSTVNNNAYRRSASGTVTQLSFPGATGTSARGINNSGEVAGMYYSSNGGHPFLCYATGAYIDLSTESIPFDNRQSSLLTVDGINNAGTVTGSADGVGIVETLNFIRDSSGNLTSFNYSSASYTSGINDLGQIIGLYTVSFSPEAVYVLKGFMRSADGSIRLLNELDALPLPPCSGYVCVQMPYSLLGINNAGDILAGATIHPPAGFCCWYYLLHPDSTLDGLLLPLPAGDASAVLLGFNNKGQVVGAGGTAANNQGFIGTYQTSSAPAIQPGGIVPLYSTATTVQSGEWVSLFGTNLASSTATWKGDFPTSLAGASVTIDGKAGYLLYASPGQINFQVPDDTTTGAVPVVVTTANGTATSTVILGPFGPSFSLLDTKHVAGIIPRANGSGAYGGGSYDILGPTGTSLGYRTVAASTGDIIELFGVGFGPTIPAEQAGKPFSGSAPAANPVKILINNMSVTPDFVGLASAGLYQINLTVPAGLGTGDVSLIASVGGVQTPSTVVIPFR